MAEMGPIEVTADVVHRVVEERTHIDPGWDDPRVIRHLALQRAIECKPYVYETRGDGTDDELNSRILTRADIFARYITVGERPASEETTA